MSDKNFYPMKMVQFHFARTLALNLKILEQPNQALSKLVKKFNLTIKSKLTYYLYKEKLKIVGLTTVQIMI